MSEQQSNQPFTPFSQVMTFQTPILVPIKYIIHFIIYFKIQEYL